MPPPLESYNGLLARTIRNLEQAQGIPQPPHQPTVGDIMQAQDQRSISDESEITSLPPTNASTPSSNLTPAPSASSDDQAALLPPPNRPPILKTLTTNLNESTALLQNLQTRNAILAADLARAKDSLNQHEQRTSFLLLEQSRSKAKWAATALCSFAVWVAYVSWCWCMSVEFEYIRKRRAEALGL